MATNFTKETKEEFGKYFEEGIHKVTIKSVTGDTNPSGKEYFEFNVVGENGEEGSARLWWTEKAMQRSFNTIRTLFVHNTVEANRDKVRAAIDATNNTDELLKLASAGLKGKEAWYQVEKTDQTYVNGNGEVRYSYNRNIYGYEPKPRKMTAEELIADFKTGDNTPVDPNEIPFS